MDQEIRFYLSGDDVRIAYARVGQGQPIVWLFYLSRNNLQRFYQSPIPKRLRTGPHVVL
jgi:hypothetical protein